jgi:hypothetical protein
LDFVRWVVPIKARGRYTLCSAIHRAEGVRRVRNGDFWKSELFAKDLSMHTEKASRSKKKLVQWFTDRTAMQNGLPDHVAMLDTDCKRVCVEVIEELLLWAGVTTADIENCTAEWREAEAFVTERGKKSPLAFFIQQARVEAAYRISRKRPGLQRQISSASSAPDSAFGGASSATTSSALDPAFGARSISDIEDGSTWGTPGERAAFAARLRQGDKFSAQPPASGPDPFVPADGGFYGAMLAQVKADPKQFAPMWTKTPTPPSRRHSSWQRIRRAELGPKLQAGSIARARNALSFLP